MVTVLLPSNWTFTVFALVFSWVVLWPSLHITSPVSWFLHRSLLTCAQVFHGVMWYWSKTQCWYWCEKWHQYDLHCIFALVLQYFTLSRASAGLLFPSHVPEAIIHSICITMMNGSWTHISGSGRKGRENVMFGSVSVFIPPFVFNYNSNLHYKALNVHARILPLKSQKSSQLMKSRELRWNRLPGGLEPQTQIFSQTFA